MRFHMAGNKDVNKLENFFHRKSTEEGSLQTRTRTENLTEGQGVG